MIYLGIYNDRNLYHELVNEDGIYATEIKTISNINKLLAFNFVIVNISEMSEFEYIDLLKKFKNIMLPKVIFLNETFAFEQLKKIMRNGAYDCWKLPIDTSVFISFLRKKYIEIQREIANSKAEAKFVLNSLRESLAYDLLYGNIKNAKDIWTRSRLANLSLIPNTVLLCHIDHFNHIVKNKGERWKYLLRKEISRTINNYSSQYESLIVLVDQQKFAVLLSLPVQLEEKTYKKLAIEYAQKLRDEINRQTIYTVTIGIGNYYEDARNLHLSYQESIQAQSYRLFQEDNSIIHIDDLNYFSTSEYYEYKFRIQEMTKKFSVGDLNGVHTIWEEIYHSVASLGNYRPDDFRILVLDILFSLSKTAIQNGANPKHLIPLQIKYAKELHQIESLVEIDKWIRKIITNYMDFVKEGHVEQILKSVHKVLQYIENNYYLDISLEDVAEKVGLSTNYLSAIFKQTTGSSFINYLTNLRMEKAKLKLQELDLSIYEVAESIGYSSSQYFSRVFKKKTGMTPTAYRNSILSVNN